MKLSDIHTKYTNPLLRMIAMAIMCISAIVPALADTDWKAVTCPMTGPGGQPVIAGGAWYNSPFTDPDDPPARPVEGSLINLGDKNPDTYWHSDYHNQADVEGHYVDIGLRYPINNRQIAVQIIRRPGSDYSVPIEFDIYCTHSIDAEPISKYGTVELPYTAWDHGNREDNSCLSMEFRINCLSVQKLRLVCTKAIRINDTTNEFEPVNHFCVSDIFVYDMGRKEPVIMDMPGGKPIINSVDQLSTPFHKPDSDHDHLEWMIDNISTTMFESNWSDYRDGRPQYLDVDMLQGYAGHNLVMRWQNRHHEGSYTGYLKKFKLYTSDDKENWTLCDEYNIPFNQGWDQGRIDWVEFMPHNNGRYLRLESTESTSNIIGNEGHNAFAIAELQFYDMGQGRTARKPSAALIYGIDQLYCNQPHLWEGNLDLLLDNDIWSVFSTWYWPNANSAGYKPEQHYLQVDLRGRLYADDNLTLCIRRRPDDILRFQPIKLRVEGSIDGNSWEPVTVLDMPHSDDYRGFYQNSIQFQAPGMRYLRFYSNEALQDVGTPNELNGAFCFSEFRLYRTNDDKLETLFYPSRSTGWDRIKEAQFVNTPGFIHPTNHQTTSTADYCDWSKWVDGKWTGDTELLEYLGIEMPTYEYIIGTDPGTGVAIQGVRQQAPTVYHEMYALPGQSINLVTFSDIQKQNAYHLNMTRWYDWQTGRTSPNLRYVVNDEDHRYEIDGAGSFGGEIFGRSFLDNTIPTFRCPDGGIEHDIYIACDMYQRVDFGNYEANWDAYSNTVYEPAVSFRHIFRIRDGRRDDINESYARKHTRNLTARANANFRIRFDDPTEDGTTSTTRLPQVYREDAGNFKYIPTTRLAVYEADGVTPCPEMQDAFIKTGKYETMGIDAAHPNIEPLDIQHLARAIHCDAANAREGSYVVKLIAGDENRNDIVVGGKNIILQQFNIDFVNENNASLLSEADLRRLHPEHSADSLRNIHGKPVAFVNFDNYARLIDSPNHDSYFAGGIWPAWHENLLPVGPNGERRFKWPLPWGKSNYGYSYEHCHDFNMYSIATDFRVTPYAGGAWDYMSFGDRLFIDTNGEQQGAFYYVNAADDPGEMVSLDINNLCAGSTLYVSGWMIEQSGGTDLSMANLVINFKVITPDGETQTVHSYVTGHPATDQKGVWHHFYYGFVFNYEELGIVPDARNKYILTLENNALSSDGADYAIDDIQVFVTRPRIYAHQILPTCSGESEAEIRVEMPFDVLMATMNQVESTDRGNQDNIGRFHYTFLKRNVYDAIMAKTGDEVEAFNAAVLKYQYDKSIDSKDQRFGTVTFSTCYLDNPDAEDIMAEGWTSTRAGREISQGERWLVFNTNPTDDEMLVGSEYYVAIYSLTDIDDDPFYVEGANLASLFAVSDGCSKVNLFRVHSSGIIKIDGIVMDDRDAITVCVDQRPVVQIDVYGMVGEGKDAHMEVLQQNAAFDWYAGPLGSVYDYDGKLVEKGYMDVVNDDKGWKLYEVMQNFRNANRDALTLDDLVYDDNFTEEQAEWLRELTRRNDSNGATPLTINNVSFIFPPIKMANEADSVNIYVTAIPINRYENTNYKVCTDPSEVRLTVKNHSPNMRHGFPLAVTEGVFTYPEWLEDVPLRIGLKQIRSTWIDMNDPEGRDYDNKLIVPLRRIHPVSEGVEEMVLTSDRNLYLADTDDFDKILGDFDNPEVPIEPGLTVIGRIVSMKAKYGEPDNELRVVFDKNFNFREGHYYRLRFNYRELNGETELNPDGSIQRKYCDGQHIFTIKIVPEFQKWVGLQSRNWANDANWSRVSALDLYVDPAEVVGKPASEYYPYVTEGRHNCTQSYAPLDFCKVIIGDKAMFNGEEISIHSPFLYDIDAAFAKVMHYNGQDYYFYDPDNMNDENGAPVDSSVPDPDEIAERGVATPGIQYDMAATTLPTASGLYCRPIYSHTVDQIHFTPGGTIANQQYLNYNRASVDMEVTPGVWSTLSSPLQETVAGNMYLPTANARQETELFKEITYNPDVNDRFRPAVYQRAWNKSGSATVHEVHPTQSTSDVAVELAWSHVFNEVAEDYAGGNAFALKVDASGVDTKPEKAMFRLPKSDHSYTYYQYEGNAGPDVNTTDIFKDEYNHYRLNDVEGDITVRARAASKYFMVGNPFMAPMDMKRFIEANRMLTPKYWVVDGRGEHAVIWDEFGFAVSSDPQAAQGMIGMGYLPPMTSVFVETTAPTDELTVHYSPDMIHQYGMVNASRGVSRGGSKSALTIAATRDGNTESAALVRYIDGSNADYDSSEDVLLINDRDTHADIARVYTTSGSMATIINTMPEGTSTGIGVLAPDEANVELVIDGGGTTGQLYLYDTVTDERTPLNGVLNVTVKGSSTGRYFITADVLEKTDIATITLSQAGHTVKVDAPGEGILKVYACDSMGRVVYSDTSDTDSMTFSLDSGIYIVKADREGCGSLVRKIVVI